MEGAALLERLKWHVALVEGLEDETPRVRSLRLTVLGWPGHLAGQHVNVRLTDRARRKPPASVVGISRSVNSGSHTCQAVV